MTWEDSVLAVLDDLEQQAAGLHLLERDAEVADLSAAEYSRVGLGARLHASVGREVRLRLLGDRVLRGRLARVGLDWLLLVDGVAEWVVRHDGIAGVEGGSDRADSEESWSVVDRVTLRAVLRRLAGDRQSCLVHHTDGRQVEGRIGRVGLDFFELVPNDGAAGAVQLVPVRAVSALQGRSR